MTSNPIEPSVLNSIAQQLSLIYRLKPKARTEVLNMPKSRGKICFRASQIETGTETVGLELLCIGEGDISN